jgi:hypothetical protein
LTIRPNLPSVEELHVNAAARHLTAARGHLQCAVLRFDDAGFEHDATARAYSFVAGIVAEFNGRPWRPQPPVPQYFQDAAVEWRADRDRRGRR